MNFPLSIIDRDKYFEQIHKYLEDEHCIVFIDTNILAQFFRLYQSARMEFFDCIDPLIKKNRIKTPAWALNEYAKKYVKGQTKEYLSAGMKLNSISKDFREAMKYLKMHVAESGVKGIGYGDLDEYHKDLDDIYNKLVKLGSVTASNKEAYINEVHNEISARFSNTVLKSNIYELIERVSINAQNRYAAQLPPGFNDSHKDYNTTGDLIIWQEILDYVKENSIRKVLFLSNDNKSDWMYMPSQIIHSGLSKPISSKLLQLADTRLVYEFSLYSGTDQLLIINTETLTQVLLSKGSKSIFELAKALQIAHSEDKSDNEDFENNVPSQDEALKEIPEATQSKDFEVNVKDNQIEDFCSEAYSDSEYFEYNSPEIGKIIEELRSHDWYTQNPAIRSIYNFPRKILNDESNRDDLFVLGRNIYQSACGGSWEAIEFINNLKEATYFPPFTETCLATGIFYEIFFDGLGKFRSGNFKTGFLETVYKMQYKHEFKEVINFINDKLNPYKEYLVILPTTDPKIIEFMINHYLDENTFFGDVQVIESVKVLNEELLVQSNSQEKSEQFIPNIDHLLEVLSSRFAIPAQQIKLTFVPELGELEGFGIRSNRYLWKGPVLEKKPLEIYLDNHDDLPF